MNHRFTNPVASAKIETPQKSLLVSTFGERVGVPMSTAKEMMAYIVFGDPQHKGGFYGENNNNSF